MQFILPIMERHQIEGKSIQTMDCNSSCTSAPQTIQFCYNSVNNSCYKESRPAYFRPLLYTITWTVILLTIIGNLLVIISISHFKQLHTPTNYLILSLAITDLLMGGFIMPQKMSQIIDTCWYYGDFFCKFYLGTVIMLCTASIIHLSVISLDRYYAVCHPLSYKVVVTVSVTVYFILISWILSALTGYTIIFLELNMKGIEYIYRNRCIGSCILVQNEASGLVSSLLSFYIPGFIMICIYLKIFTVAKRQAKSIQDISQHLQTNEQKKDAAFQKKETKAAKTLAIVLGVFLLCWLPFFLCNIINPILNHPAPPALTNVLAWIGYMNSTFNPLVYGFFYTWFRKCLKIIVSGKIFKADSSRTKLFVD
ncbi:trace amine-associated receptor 1-like [Erpetoichthys calabaricus]|uniref:trace amine-associated receptor 1-like n=1 Tax=Erpetoichthys calabaricus TaxID=27687 RepID=UPI0022347580|nr:trace amine-associated receptor 1-like [Erpetoichthys calabaricus]